MLSPQSLGGTPAMFHLSVPDAAATVARAAAEGATVQRAVQDQPYGERSGTIKDPFGHRWMIATHVEDVSKSGAAETRRGCVQDHLTELWVEWRLSFSRRRWVCAASDTLEPSLSPSGAIHGAGGSSATHTHLRLRSCLHR